MILTEKKIEFVNSLRGKKWCPGANGPDAYDCWTLTVLIQKELFDLELPAISFPKGGLSGLIEMIAEHPVRKLWTTVDEPTHGCLVQLSQSEVPHHIGTYLEVQGGGILHCDKNGVEFDSISKLQAIGWNNFSYFVYTGGREVFTKNEKNTVTGDVHGV